jgi:long-chain acyl-CoA synthetase
MGVNVGQVLRQTALRRPNDVALVELGRTRSEVTYRELDEGALRVAAALLGEGIMPGARVALFADNGRAFVQAWFGIAYAGMTVVPLPTVLTAPEVARRLAHARCDALLHDDPRYEVAAAAVDELGREIPQHEVEGLGLGELPAERPIDTTPGDTAMILYTSGTVEGVRAAVITHASLLLHTAALVHHTLRLAPEDRVMGVLPLTHSYGIRMTVLAPFYAGARTVLMPRFDSEKALAALSREEITWLPVVPTMLSAFSAEPETAPPSALHWCLSAGAPLPENLRLSAEKRLGVEVREGYGLTEATFTTVDAPPWKQSPGSVGRPVWGVEVRVVDDEGADVRPGEPGEVRVRGQNVMSAYLDDELTTLEATPGGWLATGDIGTLGGDGVLTIVDRRKDVIIRGGNNVYPSEVESALSRHPAVAEVAVVGRPDAHYGEEIVAVVVRAANADPEPGALVAVLKGELAELKHPREVAFVAALPVGPSGKIVKRELRRMLAAGEIVPQKIG